MIVYINRGSPVKGTDDATGSEWWGNWDTSPETF